MRSSAMEKETGKMEVQNVEFQNLENTQTERTGDEKVVNNRLEILLDVLLPVSIELGRTTMFIKDILELDRGSIIELDKLASEPVDVLVNGKKIAEGEVVVIDKHFGIRITNLVAVDERIKNLKK